MIRLRGMDKTTHVRNVARCIERPKEEARSTERLTKPEPPNLDGPSILESEVVEAIRMTSTFRAVKRSAERGYRSGSKLSLDPLGSPAGRTVAEHHTLPNFWRSGQPRPASSSLAGSDCAVRAGSDAWRVADPPHPVLTLDRRGDTYTTPPKSSKAVDTFETEGIVGLLSVEKTKETESRQTNNIVKIEDIVNCRYESFLTVVIDSVGISKQYRSALRLAGISKQYRSGVRLVGISKQCRSGLRLAEISEQYRSGLRLAEISKQYRSGLRLLEISKQYRSGVRLAGISKQYRSGLRLAGISKQYRSGVRLAGISKQYRSGLRLAGISKQYRSGLRLAGISKQYRSGLRLAGISKQYRSGLRLAGISKQYRSGVRLVGISKQCRSGLRLAEISEQYRSGLRLAEISKQYRSGLRLLEISKQ
ncbi:hypothetical protein RRG08_056997 [Elysia crispata]|uniref:Uncharacterized protein n=1 Tax=Elysia crispata TaxID=231223 RepID=A0AAE1DBP9_9GAST|nr:hypothetical protein RRG08_056997 [Elysia crispata]